MKRHTVVKTLIDGTLAVTAPASAAVKYAKVGGSGSICNSWANACALQTAIDAAATGDDVWIQAGTYIGPFDISASNDGARIIGGFAGTETAASQSDPTTNETILTGGTNFRALTVRDTPSTATIIRGLTLAGGTVDSTVDDGCGGGLLIANSSATNIRDSY